MYQHEHKAKMNVPGGGRRSLELAQVTQTRLLFLWPWPWPDDLNIRIWPASPEDVPANQNDVCTHSKVIVLQTDIERERDRQTYREMPPEILPPYFAGCSKPHDYRNIRNVKKNDDAAECHVLLLLLLLYTPLLLLLFLAQLAELLV